MSNITARRREKGEKADKKTRERDGLTARSVKERRKERENKRQRKRQGKRPNKRS